MDIHLKDPVAEALIQKRLATGAYATPEEVVLRALEALDAEEDWNAEDRDLLNAKLARGIEHLDQGLGISGEEAKSRLHERKKRWVADNRTSR